MQNSKQEFDRINANLRIAREKLQEARAKCYPHLLPKETTTTIIKHEVRTIP